MNPLETLTPLDGPFVIQDKRENGILVRTVIQISLEDAKAKAQERKQREREAFVKLLKEPPRG